MKKRMRLLLATATGAAVLLAGVSLTTTGASATQQAIAAGTDFNGTPTASDAFIPLDKEAEVTVTLKLKDPLGKADGSVKEVDSVSAAITPTGKTEARALTVNYTKPTPTTPTPSPSATSTPSPTLPAEATVTGTFKITKDDPAGDWKLVVKVSRGGAVADNDFTLKVSGKAGLTGASVTPNPVVLVKGKDIRVTVKVSAKDATSVSATLQSDETAESYDLGDLAKGADGIYRGETYFADDTAAGEWTLVARAVRGGQAIEGTADFSVTAPAGGASKKAKSRVTISAPGKVKAGKTFKIFGKVYRGTKAYSGKIVEVYFKKKGSTKYSFMGFAKATSTGKYTKSFKAKKDGYWRVKVPGTSKTRSAMSPQEFVDVR